MKINLKANSIEAVNELSKLNIDCGYSYSYGGSQHHEANSDNSWTVKILGQIEKCFSIFKKIPEGDKNVIYAISNSTEFLHNHFNGTEHIQDMEIVMNVNSSLNNLIKKSLKVTKQFMLPKEAYQIAESIDNYAAYIHPFTKKMVLGTSFFYNQNPEEFQTLAQKLTKKFGLASTVDHVVLHEASHAFEYINRRQYGNISDHRISDIYPLSKRLSQDYHGEVTELNNQIKEKFPGELSLINSRYMGEINCLHSEIYADVGSILLMRNKSFLENNSNTKETEKFLDSLIELRTEGQQENSKYMSSNAYVSTFNHFTSPGLEHLKSQFEQLPNRVLSPEEIHKYCQEAVDIGVARVLITNAAACNHSVGQLKTLFHLNNDGESFQLPDNLESSTYKQRMDGLKAIAGEEWLAKFQQNVSMIKQCHSEDRIKQIWHAGVNHLQFQKDIEHGIKKEQEIDELLDFLDKKPELAQTNGEIKNSEEPGFSVNKKEKTLAVISAFRKNLTSDKENKLKI